jgi:AhpD family alkylhydroperoxidase
MSLRPEILGGFAAFSNAIYPGGILERRLKELVILQSSRANACQFCINSHISMVKLAGLSDDPLKLLDSPDQHTPREALALEYIRSAMADSNRVSGELFERLRQAFTEPEIVELTMVIGLINMLNLFNNCLHVRYGGDYESASG